MAGLVALVVACGAATTFAGSPAIGDAAQCCAPAVRVSPPTTASPLPPSDRVVIIGDSLTVGMMSSSLLGSGNTIQSLLRGTGRAVFADAEVGRSTRGGVNVARGNRATVAAADVALIALGTNDVGGVPGLDVATATAEIDRMVAELRSTNPRIRIVWVDVVVERYAGRTAAWNHALAATAAGVPAFELCRWREIALANPSWFFADGIHLRVPGIIARRDVVIDCIIHG